MPADEEVPIWGGTSPTKGMRETLPVLLKRFPRDQRRTRAGGITPSPAEARARTNLQLATEIPAAILARTLGIHTHVAVASQHLSAGDWAAYANEVSRRTATENR
ncbi:hypothetical protein OOK36_44705 [Streptomyces sp. NBC_00365]|uniref:hypothetical protein n=1 Tax=Streptomyces sp. NBC_00365 TaxID=2975726 RepID=UPI00224F589F|nr:hypothetical protein [Streptomyces sp. NBC_00365]MCX5095803.1 hypothetical protein [Streptomyces sp. NBC_00365]